MEMLKQLIVFLCQYITKNMAIRLKNQSKAQNMISSSSGFSKRFSLRVFKENAGIEE